MIFPPFSKITDLGAANLTTRHACYAMFIVVESTILGESLGPDGLTSLTCLIPLTTDPSDCGRFGRRRGDALMISIYNHY